jgi:hypothetical protein
VLLLKSYGTMTSIITKFTFTLTEPQNLANPSIIATKMFANTMLHMFAKKYITWHERSTC